MKNWAKKTVLWAMMTVLTLTITTNAWALTVVDENRSPAPNGIIAILIGLYRAVFGG